jgi:hypothetical protein
VKHFFLITAYTDPEHLDNLVRSLQDEDSFFYIHLDKKSKIHSHPLILALSKTPQVNFIRRPINVFWGGFSHLRSILLLLEEAAKSQQSGYMHLLSGQCFPAKKTGAIRKFFIDNAGKEFMTCYSLESMGWTGGSANRLQLYHLNDWFNIRVRFWKRINSRFLQLQRKLGVKRKLPAFKEYYGGGTWWSITTTAANIILDTFQRDPGLSKSLRYTHCSEEIIFQTILMNSEVRNNIVSDDLRYVDWNTRDGHCPVILDERDFANIAVSNKLFARKVATGTSDKLREKFSA